MRKLGLALSNLGANQAAYLCINNSNNFLKENYQIDIIGFYENLIKTCLTPNFACMQAVELWGYDGNVVACNLNLANDIVNIPTISNRYFYIWDLEWIHLEDKQFSKIYPIYSNPNLTLIARNDDYAKITEKMWGVKIDTVIEDFNIDKFVSLIWK
jgi:hypothetical protein